MDHTASFALQHQVTSPADTKTNELVEKKRDKCNKVRKNLLTYFVKNYTQTGMQNLYKHINSYPTGYQHTERSPPEGALGIAQGLKLNLHHWSSEQQEATTGSTE
jgi:hypothetical protein